MIAATLTIGSLVAVIAITLSIASIRLRSNRNDALERINDLLPQTQCGRCGFPGCRPYAEAILMGAAQINQCVPGGDATIIAIGNLLDRPPLAPDPAFGEAKPPQVADRRRDLYRLHGLPAGLSRRCDTGRGAFYAYGHQHRVYRVRIVHRAVSSGLHHHGI